RKIARRVQEGPRQWIPNFYWRAWNRLYTFVNEIETREAGRGQNKPSNSGEILARGETPEKKEL
ncbi:MAG: hypothetical protein WCJ72_20030, partial [Chryseobacterium sp.]